VATVRILCVSPFSIALEIKLTHLFVLKDFNIRTGARYFRQDLDSCGGNVIQAVGTYNGWHLGLTIVSACRMAVNRGGLTLLKFKQGQATAAAHTSCCRCQNNLGISAYRFFVFSHSC